MCFKIFPLMYKEHLLKIDKALQQQKNECYSKKSLRIILCPKAIK